MRQLITDKKLLYLLEEIEQILGSISLEIMPHDHRAVARCSMQFDPRKGWILLYIPESETSQATLCHELAHLVLLIEGWPAFKIDSPLPKSDYYRQTMSMLTNLVLHIDVWEMVRKLGFDERPDYQPDQDYLISQIQDSCYLWNGRPQDIQSCRAANIAQGLLCPSEEAARKQLRTAADKTMPEALGLADSIIHIFDRLSPLSPKASAEALSEICGLLKIHRGMLTAIWPDTHRPNFRNRFFT
ncbi:hypothetical protein [Castellaniella sp.]|uniref:hypothetical protein n=1 Tax=Castellaniella sp. TaxID=1955812 RepID=UPI003C76477F